MKKMSKLTASEWWIEVINIATSVIAFERTTTAIDVDCDVLFKLVYVIISTTPCTATGNHPSYKFRFILYNSRQR